ncbi:MAG TPA: glutaredoxin [Gammaproteobacteria bacterium]|nr:glutaredoxin [Gammaproteobacteria bacterium]
MIFKLIRWPLGQLILLVDFLTAPKRPQRDARQQAMIDDHTRDLALYQFATCPFCVKTRRAMRRLGLNIELRDAQRDPKWRNQLLTEGGRLQTPCLRIAGESGEPRWLYESNDIIAYLEQRVMALEAAPAQA